MQILEDFLPNQILLNLHQIAVGHFNGKQTHLFFAMLNLLYQQTADK